MVCHFLTLFLLSFNAGQNVWGWMGNNDDFGSDATAGNVLFAKHEIIEIRGIGKDDKKSVHYIANAIANTLEDTMNKPVVVVDVKGHAVRYYCPWDDDDENEKDDMNNESRVGKRIELRTKYRPGQWTRKAKPIRDNRGQIVTDVNGNSIKEIPVE